MLKHSRLAYPHSPLEPFSNLYIDTYTCMSQIFNCSCIDLFIYFSFQVCFAMVIVFVVAWLPYSIFCLFVTFGMQIKPIISMIPTVFAKSACAFNPIIYGFAHKRFQMHLKQLFSNPCRNAIGQMTSEEEGRVVYEVAKESVRIKTISSSVDNKEMPDQEVKEFRFLCVPDFKYTVNRKKYHKQNISPRLPCSTRAKSGMDPGPSCSKDHDSGRFRQFSSSTRMEPRLPAAGRLLPRGAKYDFTDHFTDLNDIY